MAEGSGPNGGWTEVDEWFHQQALTNKDPEYRKTLVAREDCPEWLLKGTITQDTFFSVWEMAALNPNAPEGVIRGNLSRFPELDVDDFWERRAVKVKAYAVIREFKEQEEKAKISMGGDRDRIIAKHIVNTETAASIVEEKKNPVIPWAPTEKYRIAMVLAPAWGIMFPSYGVAKLTALMRQQGYAVRVYDGNIEAKWILTEKHGVDYWNSGRYFVWTSKDNFERIVLPDIEELLNNIVDDVINSGVKVVGFSIYNTNILAVELMARKLRERDPNICILAGGPEAIMSQWWFGAIGNIFNYVFAGESEEQLMYVLENLPEELPYNKIVGSVESRLKLESYPYADYSDYNLALYKINGINIETSRGCVAKCSFCAETHFWEYRNVAVERVVEEMEHQIKTYGTRRFWIVDSLINGNLKSFNKLMDLIIEKDLDIKWNCYSRCDGRMDREFFDKIKRSGCTLLSFGIESGSQKVLDDMHKKVKIWEIEQNMKDCHEAGIYIHSSWLQGFPTERPLDFLHNLQLMYTCREWIDAISPGMGAGITPNSDMDTNWQAYGMQWKSFREDGTVWKGAPQDKCFGDWYTEGYRNTTLQRFLRVKLVNIWLKEFKKHIPESIIENGNDYPDLEKLYSLEFKERRSVTKLVQNNYLDLRQSGSEDFKGIILQEYLGFIYGLWQVYGELTWTFKCDPEIDDRNFGEHLVRLYWCELTADIDLEGNYTIQVYHKLDHTDPKGEDRDLLEPDRTGMKNYALERERQDLSFEQSITLTGNVNNWQSSEIQVEETVHPQYRKKSWKLETA